MNNGNEIVILRFFFNGKIENLPKHEIFFNEKYNNNKTKKTFPVNVFDKNIIFSIYVH